MDDAHTRAHRRRRARRRRPDRRGRHGARRRPTGALEIDATGGIVMPGMIDTHRHMWQTAMRGVRRRLDAHPVLRLVLPRARQAVPPRGHPRRQPALRPGTRSRPASPPPSTGRTACRPSTTPRPPSTRCRRCPAGSCWPTATSRPARGSGPPTRRCGRSSTGAGRDDDMLGFQLAFDVTGDPAFPEKAGLRGGPRARPAGHHPRRRLGRDQRRRHPADARERLHDPGERLRARGDADRRTPTSGSPRPAARSRCRRSPSRAPARATRPPGRCAGTTSRCRCRWTPACGGAATCSRPCAPRSAPTARASTSRRTPPATPSPTSHLRAEQVVDWATRGGARALGPRRPRPARARARRPTSC